jgi:hypothetical protein
MEHAAPAIFVALEQSGFAAAIRQSIWIYPLANIGHIVALVFFAGAIAVMDLRLLGAFSQTEPKVVIGWARRAAAVALSFMAATGFVLFSAEASHVAINPVFQFKMILVALGLLNVAGYELMARRKVEALPAGAPMPKSVRAAAYVSLGVWIAVAACGRSIAYF